MVMQISAQKYGHINSQAILLDMPDIKAADADLQAYQNQLMKVGEDKVKKFEADYQALVQKVNNGEMAPVQIKSEEARLAGVQQEIRQYEVEMQSKVAEKREKLYAPIFDKVDTVIKEIGDAGEFTMIFDTSGGAILFVDDSVDITAQVRAKLGI